MKELKEVITKPHTHTHTQTDRQTDRHLYIKAKFTAFTQGSQTHRFAVLTAFCSGAENDFR